MMVLGPIGFGAPLALLALAALPLLWWLLRALPPMPRRVRFPGTALLVDRIAGRVRHLQTGRLYNYAFAMILGLIVLLAVLVRMVGA